MPIVGQSDSKQDKDAEGDRQYVSIDIVLDIYVYTDHCYAGTDKQNVKGRHNPSFFFATDLVLKLLSKILTYI
jgi:hypothetical protein